MTILDIEEMLRSGQYHWHVIGGTQRSQIALMVIAPGDATGSEPSVHPEEDQILYVIRGELDGQLGEDAARIRAGQLVIIPAGVPHRFTNPGDVPAETINFYAPPAF